MNVDKILTQLSLKFYPFTYNARELGDEQAAIQMLTVSWHPEDDITKVSHLKPQGIFADIEVARQYGFSNIETQLGSMDERSIELQQHIGLIGVPNNAEPQYLSHPFHCDKSQTLAEILRENLPSNYEGKVLVVITTWLWHPVARYSPTNGVLAARHDVYFVK